MGAYHNDLSKNVARCRDSEVRIQRALKLANVDLGCLNVMASPSLFLHFFRQLVFPCSYLIRGTIPTSVLVLVEKNFLLPCIIYNYICTVYMCNSLFHVPSIIDTINHTGHMFLLYTSYSAFAPAKYNLCFKLDYIVLLKLDRAPRARSSKTMWSKTR